MQTVLIAVHLMIVIALVAVVLLQRSEGGALGVGGGSGFMTGRGQANILTRATAILAALFFITSLGLTLLARYGHGNKLDFNVVQPAAQAPKGPTPASGSVLDQVRQIEQERKVTPSGATPSTGVAPATPSPAPAGGVSTSTTPTKSTAPAEPSGLPDRPTPNAPAAQQPATPAPSK